MFEDLKTILEILVLCAAILESPLLLGTAVAAIFMYLMMTDGNN